MRAKPAATTKELIFHKIKQKREEEDIFLKKISPKNDCLANCNISIEG